MAEKHGNLPFINVKVYDIKFVSVSQCRYEKSLEMKLVVLGKGIIVEAFVLVLIKNSIITLKRERFQCTCGF